MIYIAAAMAAEARPFIERLKLKADRDFKKIRVYKNENAILTLTGTGIIKSAASLSFVLGRLTPNTGDIFLNVGICGGEKPGTYICSKISCPGLERDFYPDMIYKSGFEEGELITYSKPQEHIPEGTLADTEGAALVQAAKPYFSPDRIFIVKTVSDSGDFSSVTPKKAESLVSEHFAEVNDFLNKIPPAESPAELTAEEIKEAEKFNFTFSQSIMLKNLLIYYGLKGGNSLELLRGFEEVKTKAEGRLVLERIKNRVL